MPITGTPKQRKAKVFDEFKAGALHSGKGGPVVKDRNQAVAIALSEAGEAKPKRRGKTASLVLGLALASSAAWAQTPPTGSPSLNQAVSARVVTKSDATILPATRGIYVGDAAACNLAVVFQADNVTGAGTAVTFSNVQPGSLLPFQVAKVMAATTCTIVLALY